MYKSAFHSLCVNNTHVNILCLWHVATCERSKSKSMTVLKGLLHARGFVTGNGASATLLPSGRIAGFIVHTIEFMYLTKCCFASSKVPEANTLSMSGAP